MSETDCPEKCNCFIYKLELVIVRFKIKMGLSERVQQIKRSNRKKASKRKPAMLAVVFSLVMASCTNQVAAGPVATATSETPCMDYEEDGFVSYDGKYA